MKRLIIFCIFLTISAAMSTAEAENRRQDVFATWTDFIVRKDLGKWHVGGLLEYCTIQDGNMLKHNEVIVRPIVGYNALPWLRLQMQVDALYSFYDGFFLRYLPDVSFHLKASQFRFSLRNRLQLTHQLTSGKLTPVIRTRAKIDYVIPKSPVSVHLAAEPYWLKDFIKTRYYLGADFSICQQFSLSLDYLRYQHYRPGTKDQNVAYLTLYVHLK